jgi:DNA repair protein RecO (recombination protein O)
MSSLQDIAVILRTYRIGEADKIVVLFTKDHGKMRAVAKGSRKTTSKLGARLEPLGLVNVILWQGRNLATITGVDVIDNFAEVRHNLDKIMMATTMLEIIDKSTLDNQENDDLFQLLTKALATLDKNFSPGILGAFCFRTLMIEGLTPQIDNCCSCNTTEDLTAFNVTVGGVLCKNCQSGQLISQQALDTLKLIFSGQLAKALHMCSHVPELRNEIESLGINTLEHHLGQKLKSHLNLTTWV